MGTPQIHCIREISFALFYRWRNWGGSERWNDFSMFTHLINGTTIFEHSSTCSRGWGVQVFLLLLFSLFLLEVRGRVSLYKAANIHKVWEKRIMKSYASISRFQKICPQFANVTSSIPSPYFLLNWRIVSLQCCIGSAVQHHKSAINIHMSHSL